MPWFGYAKEVGMCYKSLSFLGNLQENTGNPFYGIRRKGIIIKSKEELIAEGEAMRQENDDLYKTVRALEEEELPASPKKQINEKYDALVASLKEKAIKRPKKGKINITKRLSVSKVLNEQYEADSFFSDIDRATAVSKLYTKAKNDEISDYLLLFNKFDASYVDENDKLKKYKNSHLKLMIEGKRKAESVDLNTICKGLKEKFGDVGGFTKERVREMRFVFKEASGKRDGQRSERVY